MLTLNEIKANPLVVCRKESDEWAILFDPDTGEGFTVNPVGAFIWERLNGKNSAGDIITELKKECGGEVSSDVEAHYEEFIEELQKRGLAGRKEGGQMSGLSSKIQ